MIFQNRITTFYCLLLTIVSLASSFLISPRDPDRTDRTQDQSSKAPPLSPLDSIATMQLQPGYSVVPVLTEPHIHEPTAITWDGNGRMYVVEMRAYMQDIDGKQQLQKNGRVSRHEDTDGDGVYDRHTVFADNLALPRMVLPLLDRVIIRETNTFDLKSYQDTDGDGIADKIEMWHEGGKRGGNLEHQPSGLLWNIDNWVYTTYSAHRYRFTRDAATREKLPHGSGQWGLTQDNEGRMFYSTAGGENPVMDFQRPIVYGKISLKGEQAPRFRDVYPLVEIPDVQGGAKRLNKNNTLNKFTGCCGQSIFSGTGLPDDFSGDLIIPEPVGRLIRRAKVTNDQGRIVVSNAYEDQEFIAARDPNFRPVNSATGPDGCLYIVDMYRGIIQEGNWVREGSYLRKIVQEYELDKNIGRGRIFRVDHETTKRGPQPRMLDETPGQLIKHLSHPNGWWRMEAQKLIVLHNDKSVVPALQELVREGKSPLGRLHALWTLDGLESVDTQLLLTSMVDADPKVRAAAIRISESRMESDRTLDGAIAKLANDADPNVLIQVVLSVSKGAHPDAESLVENIITANPENSAIASIAQQLKKSLETMLAEKAKLAEMRRRNQALADSVVRGKVTYNTLCTTCHGENGKGKADEDGLLLAPALVGSPRVTGHKERLNRILINGLMGPIDNKTYSAGIMLPMGANSDDWIADVANYIRNSWGNESGIIESSDVTRVRSEAQSHIGPWTLKELAFFDPPPMENRQAWKLTSNCNPENLNRMLDGDPKTRWDSGKTQKPGMWLAIEFPEPVKVLTLKLDATGSDKDYPRGYEIRYSDDGKTWSEVAAKGQPSASSITNIELDGPPTRHLKITQTGSVRNKFWSIHELYIKGLTANDKPPAPLSESLMSIDAEQLAAEAVESGDVTRGAAIFFNPALSCAKCHEPKAGERLGPDLASRRDGVTHPYVVDSILSPSKAIRKEFSQTKVLTIDGQVITGFLVSEDDEKIVVREPAGGKEITIPIDDVEDTAVSKVSAMPAGLINQLEDKQQFLDLTKFLIEVNEDRELFDSLKPKG